MGRAVALRLHHFWLAWVDLKLEMEEKGGITGRSGKYGRVAPQTGQPGMKEVSFMVQCLRQMRGKGSLHLKMLVLVSLISAGG